MPTKKKSTKRTSAKKGVGITPLADRIVIEEIDTDGGESRTESGIYIPANANKDTKDAKRGIVRAVGAGRIEGGKRILPEVRVGQTVLFSWGDSVTLDGTTYFIVNEGNISAIID